MKYKVRWHTAIAPSSTYYEGEKEIWIPEYIEDRVLFAKKLISKDGGWSVGHIVIDMLENNL